MKALAAVNHKASDREDLGSGLSVDTTNDDVEFLGTQKGSKGDNSNSHSSNTSGSKLSSYESKSSKSMSIEDPPTPYRKSRDTKSDLGFKALTNKTADSPPKRSKVITPGKTGRRNPTRTHSKSVTRSKSPVTGEGSGVSL